MAVKKDKKDKANPYKIALVVITAIAAVATWTAFNQGYAKGKKAGISETENGLKNRAIQLLVPDNYSNQHWNSRSVVCYPLRGDGNCSQQIIDGTTKMLGEAFDYVRSMTPSTTVIRQAPAPIQLHNTNCYRFGNFTNCTGY